MEIINSRNNSICKSERHIVIYEADLGYSCGLGFLSGNFKKISAFKKKVYVAVLFFLLLLREDAPELHLESLSLRSSLGDFLKLFCLQLKNVRGGISKDGTRQQDLTFALLLIILSCLSQKILESIEN